MALKQLEANNDDVNEVILIDQEVRMCNMDPEL